MHVGVRLLATFKVPCEQSENIERFRVNDVSGPIFQLVENSSGAVRELKTYQVFFLSFFFFFFTFLFFFSFLLDKRFTTAWLLEIRSRAKSFIWRDFGNSVYHASSSFDGVEENHQFFLNFRQFSNVLEGYDMLLQTPWLTLSIKSKYKSEWRRASVKSDRNVRAG